MSRRAAIRTSLCAIGSAFLLIITLPQSASAEACRLAPQHAGVAFPVERVNPAWVCRLQPIIEDYTTANKVGPVLTPLQESVYVYLLDRPPVAAALVNRLELGLYKAETRGPGRYWGNDGEGTEGLVELVYQDPRHRLYYLEGSHHSTLLPHVTGKRTVTRKLMRGVDAVTQLGLEMRRQPDRVLFEASDPPPLPPEDVAFLTQALAAMPHAATSHEKGPASR